MIMVADVYLEELTVGAVIIIGAVVLFVAWRGVNLHHHFDQNDKEPPDRPEGQSRGSESEHLGE